MDAQDLEAIRNALEVPKCRHCGSTITAIQKISPGFCGSEPCFQANIRYNQVQLQILREQNYRERQDAARENAPEAMARAAEKHGCSIDELLIAVVPFQNAPLQPLSEDRRAAFEAHVDKSIDDALAADPNDPVLGSYEQNVSAEPPIVDAGCAACQGFCCKRGGGDNHAFVSRQTVFHLMKMQPDLTKEDILEHFLERLPEESVKDACVYQGPVGCTLERDWRAGLCNTFHCHDIYAMHDLTGGRADVPLVVVGIEENEPGSVGTFDMENGFQRED